METSDYQKRANDFAKKHGITLKIKGSHYGKHFANDKEERFIFTIQLKHGGKSYTFKFGQSIAAGAKEPTMYDVLTCLQKYEVGTFENFCGDFGYDQDSRTAERIYKAVCKEFENMERLFSHEILEEMQEIQ